jgi:hypothetical protein
MRKVILKAFFDGFWCAINPLISVAWLLYWAGDLASKVLSLRDSERWCLFWYPVYDRLMRWSYRVQGGAKCGPWSDLA